MKQEAEEKHRQNVEEKELQLSALCEEKDALDEEIENLKRLLAEKEATSNALKSKIETLTEELNIAFPDLPDESDLNADRERLDTLEEDLSLKRTKLEKTKEEKVEFCERTNTEVSSRSQKSAPRFL